MRVLGLDTATWRASAGIWRDGAVVAECASPTRGNHAAIVLALVEEALCKAGCRLGDIDLVSVSGGPGSFSGLRVGVSVAKGFALATGLPVVAVSTLEALARGAVGRDGPICAALDAHKGELYAAFFESCRGRYARSSEDALVTFDALVARIPVPCVVVGNVVERYGEILRTRLGNGVELLDPAAHAPAGGTVAALGWEHWQRSGPMDAARLEPFYVRPPDAAVGIR